MMDPQNHDARGPFEAPLDRLQELLADRAVFGLSADETAELETLLAVAPATHRDDLDLLAADLARSYLPATPEPPPAAMLARALHGAQAFAAGKKASGPAASAAEAAAPQAAAGNGSAATGPAVEIRTVPAAAVAVPAAADAEGAEEPATFQEAEDASRRQWLVKTFIAMAAGVLVAVSLGRQLTPPQPSSADERRRALLASASKGDVLRLPWTATADPAAKGASGDVVWDGAAQEGYMLFRGLAANDPTREQYQLWVFDADRDERYPVDGGVFDVPAGATEVVVPITARLSVKKPALFAVTIERPGGVVVSDRKRLPLLAKPPAG